LWAFRNVNKIVASEHSANWRTKMKYKIALQQSEEGFSVSVPGLPGCWSQGATEQEAIENIKDAIREYLAAVEEQLRGENVREIEVSV
jgi:predicted RNase H-like HicB family nuclease